MTARYERVMEGLFPNLPTTPLKISIPIVVPYRILGVVIDAGLGGSFFGEAIKFHYVGYQPDYDRIMRLYKLSKKGESVGICSSLLTRHSSSRSVLLPILVGLVFKMS